jgi:hypothetical protein
MVVEPPGTEEPVPGSIREIVRVEVHNALGPVYDKLNDLHIIFQEVHQMIGTGQVALSGNDQQLVREIASLRWQLLQLGVTPSDGANRPS